jgi:signal transduction histidine kinase
MMSHELRTPLNAVIGFSDLMRIEAFGPVGSDRYREYAGDIHDSARHLLSLINDILDLSKIERGSLKPEDEVLEVATAVSAVETLVKDRAERGKVTLQIRLPEALPALKADPRQLKQMLANLLTNAIKFTDPGGSVTVEVRQDAKKGYRFDVNDTGVGLAPEDIPKALAPFVQVERGHGHKHEGTGLGLPLTKRMIELHGGRLELTSEFGVGTRVALIFPPSRIVAVDASNSGPAGAEEGNGRGGSVERMAGGSNPRQEPAHPA